MPATRFNNARDDQHRPPGTPTVAMIERHTMEFDDRLATYLDMTPAQLAAVIDRSTPGQCREVAATLEAMADTLVELAKALRQSTRRDAR